MRRIIDAAGPNPIINFYVLDEITNEHYLCSCVRNFSICEFFLDQDRQFNNIQQVESEIVTEV